jgi:UDP-N-acetylmuramate dehydrogenase
MTIQILENISLNSFTTIKTGGPARFLITCGNEAEIGSALDFAAGRNLPALVLGGGSNLLISDQGYAGVVIQNNIQGMSFDDHGNVVVGAGVVWDLFVAETVGRKLAGIEALSGIPGTAGATPIQNVGAYGQEVSDTISSVKAIHRKTKSTRIFSKSECAFGYRDSVFKRSERDQWVIVEVTFKLSGTPVEPTYKELLVAVTESPSLENAHPGEKIAMIRDQVLKIRARKGMVLNSEDPDTRSLGSYFMNPIVTTTDKNRVVEIWATRAPGQPVPAYSVGQDLWKIPAAWLIESSGISKGFALGNARVSTKHVLALTNPGHASTSDILSLERLIEKSVADAFGITLKREPELIG